MDKLNDFSPPQPLDTAVLFLVFNRLDTTKLVFNAIKKAKPPRIYLASDGARTEQVGEKEKVENIREFILSNIDWKCEVKTLFRSENLGCKYAISGAIDWFFENEEMGIILEDDCLPSQSFFWFCQNLLKLYKNDSRIFMISGFNKQNEWRKKNESYFFSNFGGVWGWASWSRAWEKFDVEMPDIEQFIESRQFEDLLGSKLGNKRKMEFLSCIEHKIDTWDYPWAYTRHKNNGLSCVPSKSLIKNIGFGEDSTHTTIDFNKKVNIHNLKFPIIENKSKIPDLEYDNLFLKSPNLIVRIIKKIYSLIK